MNLKRIVINKDNIEDVSKVFGSWHNLTKILDKINLTWRNKEVVYFSYLFDKKDRVWAFPKKFNIDDLINSEYEGYVIEVNLSVSLIEEILTYKPNLSYRKY